MFAVDRFALQILQRIMHEPHIPFETKTEATQCGWLRHAGECCRLLSDGDNAGTIAVSLVIHALEKGDGLKVLAPAMFVGNPFALFARVIQIEHGGHRIDAKPVEMITVKPEQSIVNEVAGDLAAAEIEDRGVPVRMISLARVLMLVECCAIKASEAMFVGWEMRWHPVENDADSSLVGHIDQCGETFGIAKTRGGRIKPRWLITPGGIEGMLGDRHQFYMGEPHIGHITDQVFSQFSIAQKRVPGLALPRSEMDLINGDWRPSLVTRFARLQIGGVSPFELVSNSDTGRCLGAKLRGKTKWIGFQWQKFSARSQQLILVGLPRDRAGYEDFPHADVKPLAHDMAAAIPVIEIANNRNPFSIGRPHGKMNALNTFMYKGMGAQLVIKPEMTAFCEKIVVLWPQNRA